MSHGASASDIARLITVSSDTGDVSIGGERFIDCLTRPKRELIDWLYCVLHVGNPRLLDGFGQDRWDREFEGCIRASVEDPRISIRATAHSMRCPGDTESKTFTVYDASGVMVVGEEDDPTMLNLPCFRPRLSPGFFMFVHNRPQCLQPGESVRRYYVSASDPKFALAVWSSAIRELVARDVEFSTKILSNRRSFPRNDALVFYCRDAENSVPEVLQSSLQDAPEDLFSSCSPLCASIGVHLSTASQPLIDGEERSFGESRCIPIAEAILDYAITGMNFVSLLSNRFQISGIDSQDVSRNSCSSVE